MIAVNDMDKTQYHFNKGPHTSDLYKNLQINKTDYIPTDMPVLRFLYKLSIQRYSK